MAIITDPLVLVDTTDIVVDPEAKTIRILTSGNVSNAGSTGGVSGQALYSWLKRQWKVNSTYIKYSFPMEAITPEQYDFISGWSPYDNTTRKLIRNAGWSEKDSSGVTVAKYAGIISLGSLSPSAVPYYNFNSSTPTSFSFTGSVNEAIQVFGDSSHGSVDHTSGDVLSVYCRERATLYSSATSLSIGISNLGYQVYRLPLTSLPDVNISASDAIISTTSPYTGITVTYYPTDQMFDVDGDASTEPYDIVVTASVPASPSQVYEKLQYLLRQPSDIDSGAGTVYGKTANSIASFVGNTFEGVTGVIVNGLDPNYYNSVKYTDVNGVVRRYPFAATGTINFGSYAGSGDFIYKMYFTSTPSTSFGSSSALVVKDLNLSNIEGTYTGFPVPFSFSYDSNTQGDRVAGTDAPITLVGIGLSGGQYVEVSYTITRSSGQTIWLSPNQERNYLA